MTHETQMLRLYSNKVKAKRRLVSYWDGLLTEILKHYLKLHAENCADTNFVKCRCRTILGGRGGRLGVLHF